MLIIGNAYSNGFVAYHYWKKQWTCDVAEARSCDANGYKQIMSYLQLCSMKWQGALNLERHNWTILLAVGSRVQTSCHFIEWKLQNCLWSCFNLNSNHLLCQWTAVLSPCYMLHASVFVWFYERVLIACSGAPLSTAQCDGEKQH